MGVTQLDIARRVGLDVSSVNKILNRRPGPVFRKDTIKQVFKIARELGYDFGRLKYHHKRGSNRKPMAVPLELSIYNSDGTLFDKGAAIVKDVSLSGALLTAVVLPQQSIPLRPHTIGIRMLDGALKGVEILGRPVRLAHSGQGQGMNLAVEFLRTEEVKLKKLRKIL
jgi:transcriptional regulator with XRE-family HTH domain